MDNATRGNWAALPSSTNPDWRTTASVVALVLALAALVFLPIWRARLVEPLHKDLRSDVEPARSIVTRLHLAIATEGALARELVVRRDTLLINGYRAALSDELDAYRQLEPHAKNLGPDVRGEFNSLKALQVTWHTEMEESFRALSSRRQSSADSVRRQGDPFHPADYERLLVGAARLDEALSNAADRRWAEADATNSAQRWLSAVVGVIALGAAIIVASLVRGLRLYAIAADRDRAELQQAVDARARLVRGITHDLKNPLNAIIGYTDLLMQGVQGRLSDQQLESIRRIHRSAESLLALIDDILAMSQAERRTLSIDARETDIAPVIQSAADEHAAAAAAAGQVITTELAPNLPAVSTDPRRVRQVLGNLLSNAIKYSPRGGEIRIRARLAPRTTPGAPWIAIDVADDGPGVPSDKKSAIFEEFTRLEMHRDKPGAGLGLAIASRVTNLLGGDLTVESKDGHGSVFTIWLPGPRDLRG